MKQKTRTTLFALCLAMLGTLGACSRDDVPEENTTATGNPITLTPALSAQAWTEGSGTQTRADATRSITFTPGGGIAIGMSTTADFSTDVQMNVFEIDATGKLVRIPDSDPNSDETEANLNVPGPGTYYFITVGYVNCLLSTGIPDTPGIPMKAPIGTPTPISCNIAADGKFTIDCKLITPGIELKLLTPAGDPYTAADVTAQPSANLDYYKDRPDPILVPTTGLAAWGELYRQLIDQGDEVMRLTVGGTTYKVISPARISLIAGRLVTFSVRVGATGITVEMKDGSNVVTDFEVEPVTNAEAEIPGSYNGVMGKKLAIAGLESYWIAPVNEPTAGMAVQDIPFATICPNGWHVPTLNDLMAMTGYTNIFSGGRPDTVNKDAIFEAFGEVDTSYLSSDKYGDDRYRKLYIWSDKGYAISSIGVTDTTGFQLRCVKKAN